MATQTKSNPVTESVETAAERFAELNEKAVANGKKAGAAYLSSFERAVVSAADSYEKTPGATKLEWLATAAATQADLAREVTQAYTTAARDFVS